MASGNPVKTHALLLIGLSVALLIATGQAWGQERPCGPGLPDVCLSGQVCQFPVGDCAMVNGVCADAPGCDAASGPVCGCNSNSFDDACAAMAAGVVVASLGACTNPDSCTNGCGPNQFCRLPDGMCSRFEILDVACSVIDVFQPMLDNFGVCTTKPTECPPDSDPVCSCDNAFFLNACEATKAGRSIGNYGSCEFYESCGGFFGDSCSNPLDICVTGCGRCSVFDDSGFCEQDPNQCDDSCAPVCSCDGTWYRNRCHWLQAVPTSSSSPTSYTNPAGCGETFALQFVSKVDMFWGSVGPFDYNVYRAAITGSGPPGPWNCVGSSLAQPPYPVNGIPSPGEIWGFAVTQVDAGTEGPLGYGGSACSPRVIATSCAP